MTYKLPKFCVLPSGWSSVIIFCMLLIFVITYVRFWLIAAAKFEFCVLLSWRPNVAASLSLGIVLLLPLMGFAEEVSAVNAASAVDAASSVSADRAENADSPPADTDFSMDPTRNYLSGKLESWAKSTDSFFGDYRNYQESNDSVVQVNVTQVRGDQGVSALEYAFNLKFSLPNTEKKMQFLIETNPDEKSASIQTKTEAQLNKTSTSPAKVAAALRYEKAEAERWRFSTDGGILLAGLASTPFVRARLGMTMPLDKWRLNVAESVFWYGNIGAGESTLIDFERQLSERQLLRISSNATWLNNTQNFDLSQNFSVYHTFDERSALLYQVSVIGATLPTTQVTDYVILTRYRYRWHREWVYLDISPQAHFPQALNYQSSLLLIVGLEFLFDKSR